MSKPNFDDPDLPPEPDADLPPEPSLRSASRSISVSVDDVAAVKPPPPSQPPAPPPEALAEELLGSADQANPSVSATGDVLTVGGARYRLTKRLGAGGMGEVFLGTRLGTGGFERDVALKTVLPQLAGHTTRSEQFFKSFTDEARLAAMLHHPGICQVFDLQPLEGRGLIQVLEYVPGHSLKNIIDAAKKKGASLSEAFACFVAYEVAAALDYAHTVKDSKGKPLNIVHRDVTPHNVMVADTGGVKLLDFGIAFSALENRDVTRSNMVKGKDQYYAPEQLVGDKLDGRADEFALALCLYEMLTLKRFFTRGKTDTDTQLHMRIASLTPESVEGTLDGAPIDKSLRTILHHALAPARDERFPTCAEFGDALRVFSQRRGWLYTAADARKELEALFALPDNVDADKTNPSGKRVQSTVPRHIPRSTVQLPALTPGRTASTPAEPRPLEISQAKPSTGPAPVGGTPEPVRKLENEFFSAAPADEPAEGSAPSRSVSLKPSESAMRRRLQLQEDLHNPQTKAKKQLALPAAIMGGLLFVGVVGVKLFLVSTERDSSKDVVEVVKTPEQLRAEAEARERAQETATTPPPQLAPAPIVEAAPPTPEPVAKAPAPRRVKKTNADAQDVDAMLAARYGGGRPVVTPDAPAGAVDGAPVAAPMPRRRSLDTVMVADTPAESESAVLMPKGTVIAARLASPADSSQPAPVNATVSADVVVGGAVVVPKGSRLVCMTAPAGARLNLNCDTLQLGRRAVNLDGVAMGSDKRVGLPLPRQTSTTGAGGAIARDTALATGRAILGRVTPDGVGGDLVNGGADGTTAGIRSATNGDTSGQPAALLPVGTAFTVFLQQPAH